MREWKKAALRGEPSYVWREGQRRRLDMILSCAGARAAGRILDNGCGVGAYLKHLSPLANHAHGVELEPARALQARQEQLSITLAEGEHLPYRNECFDLILSHEVLEHVADDRQAIEEVVRLLRKPSTAASTPGGRLILFVPNRGYPFETHGIFLRGRYRFGNIPLINYLPRVLRDRLAPHVRVYSRKDLRQLLHGLPLQIVRQEIVFGAYDNIIARWPRIGRILRAILQSLERTPLRVLGLSHFWVLERIDPTGA